ncbi:MAG: NAD(P)H-dependent oxidoreductase [Paludibacteraceae bacterium]|nr:NAD(P)H-dependent oxidoreductase [Paludibacteraceae bacterium]
MKKILIINGNPDKNSLSFELATAYKKGADASGAACTLVHLSPTLARVCDPCHST